MALIKGTGAAETLNGTAGNDYIYAYGGGDTVYAGDGNDVIYGGDGADSLYGGAGDDQLSGGGGGDYMEGGTGNDTYYVQSADDRVVEFSNEGIDTVVSSLTNYRIGANIERLRIADDAALDAAGRSNGSGNELDNRLSGNNGANTLKGFGGNDSIYGYGGDDIIDGGVGNDVLDGGDGIDTIQFEDESLALGYGVKVDLAITSGQNTGFGIDKITNFENIQGTIYDDVLRGNAGANKIKADSGSDIIQGRGGDDDLTAGTGADTFIFEAAGAANGFDRIRDFKTGIDHLEFHIADGYSATAGFETISSTATTINGSLEAAQFIYNSTTQILYYDADGSGADAAVALANFNSNPATVITASDIVII